MEEIRGRLDDPAERVYRRAWGRMFGGAIAHPVAGTIASVARIRPRDVARFLQQRLTHANTVLAVVGGASEARVRASGAPALPPRRARRRGAGARRCGAGWAAASACAIATAARRTSPCSCRCSRRRARCSRPASRSTSSAPIPTAASSRSCASVSASATRSVRTSSGDPTGPARWSPPAAPAAAPSASRAPSRTPAGAPAQEGFGADELDRARKKLRYRYAVLADSRLDLAVALAESAPLGLPDAGGDRAHRWRGCRTPKIEDALAAGGARPRRARAAHLSTVAPRRAGSRPPLQRPTIVADLQQRGSRR